MRIEIPTHCPCCDYKLEFVNDQLFCRNTACSAQLNKKLEHFAKVLGIKGLGPKTIEKIGFSDIIEIFYIEEDELAKAVGKTVAAKLISEIERAKSASLAEVLASFSIPLVGGTASDKIAAHVSSIEEITREKCREAGLGEKVTENLVSWIETDFQDMKQFLPFSFKSTKISDTSNNGVICITGKLKTFKTKAEATLAIEAAGFKVSESVTKATDYLVDEDNKGSTKRTKAESLGIPIIPNLKEFLETL
jgi:DNA ligase (NAD+)